MTTRLPLKDFEFIRDFAAFCRTKGDEGYDYLDPWECACAQFLKASGRAAAPSTAGGFWVDRAIDRYARHPLPNGLDGIGGALLEDPRTFSALATRLDALLVDAPGFVGELG